MKNLVTIVAILSLLALGPVFANSGVQSNNSGFGGKKCFALAK